MVAAKEGVQCRLWHHRPEPQQLRGLQTTAPLARINPGLPDARLGQTSAKRAGLLPTGLVQIALAGTIAQAEVHRVAGAGGVCVTQHQQPPRFGELGQIECLRRQAGTGDRANHSGEDQDGVPHGWILPEDTQQAAPGKRRRIRHAQRQTTLSSAAVFLAVVLGRVVSAHQLWCPAAQVEGGDVGHTELDAEQR